MLELTKKTSVLTTAKLRMTLWKREYVSYSCYDEMLSKSSTPIRPITLTSLL